MLASIAFFILWSTAIERFVPFLGLGRCPPTNVKKRLGGGEFISTKDNLFLIEFQA